MPSTTEIEFSLNGRPTRVSVPPSTSVLTMLRETLDLTGAKLACGEGECGACTVIVDGKSVNSCIMFAVDCDGVPLEVPGSAKATCRRVGDRCTPDAAPSRTSHVVQWRTTRCAWERLSRLPRPIDT